MLLIRSLIFNLFLYTGIVLVFLIAIPTLLMPPKFALFFGKFLQRTSYAHLTGMFRNKSTLGFVLQDLSQF